MTGDPVADGHADAEGLRTIRRIEAMAAGWGLVGVLAFLVAGRPRGALVLTLAALASIVAFRGLQRVIYALGPVAGKPKRGAWRRFLLVLARYSLLGGAIVAAFLLAPNELLGLIAGFSTLPAALMSEGALQAVRALRKERPRNDDEPS